MPLPISAFRERLEEMTAEALQEYYEHFAGHKAVLELARVYERHADLCTLEQVGSLAGQQAHPELQRFAAETYIGNGVRELTDRIGNTEAALTVQVDGERIPYRGVRPRILNEPDPHRRRELHARRCAVTEEHLNPLLVEAADRERELTADLGAPDVRSLYERFGYDPRGLSAATAALLEATEGLYRREVDHALRARLGIPLADAHVSDLARLWRAPEFDPGFPADRALPALRATLAELGIDLDTQRNVEIDIEPRPGKRPRAFCAPIRVPGRVVLVILPQGGQEDYRALFHEAGHTEHFAHTSPELPAEARVLGDNGVTEGFAFLLEHLVANPAWQAARLDFPRAQEYVRFSALQKLFFIRRYAAKLAYELELHSGAALDSLPDRYVEHLSRALGVAYPASDYLEDVDGGFYCTCYLRAWAFESQLAAHLQERFGSTWFRRRAAGGLLREVWELGQSLRADELLREISGERLAFDVLAADARAALA
ncbi:MAG: hypothetical protein ACXVYV_04875 [Gaiellales bacterium]